MTTARPLDIKVVYSASNRRGRAGRVAHGVRPSRRSYLVLLGIANLVAASGLYYAAWWRIDSFLYLRIVTKSYIPGVDLDAAAGILGPELANSPERQSAPPEREAPPNSPRYTGQTGNIIMGITAYSWLTLATIACCAIALSFGTAMGRVGGAAWRRAGMILALGMLLALSWGAYSTWTEYRMQYPPNHLRLGMGGLVLLAALFGIALGRGVRGLTYLAAIALIISAIGSAVGVYLGIQCGAIATQELPLSLFPFVVLVFVVHSLWGWILLPVASRIGR